MEESPLEELPLEELPLEEAAPRLFSTPPASAVALLTWYEGTDISFIA